MNETEFICWILLIEYYIANVSDKKLEYETLIHIGIIAKNKINPNFLNYLNQSINQDEFDKTNSILISKEIGIKEFNKKYNYYIWSVKAQNKRFYIDFEKMANDIVKPINSKKNDKYIDDENSPKYYWEQNHTSVLSIDQYEKEIFMEQELNNQYYDKDDSSYSEKNIKNFLKNNLFLKK